MLPALQDLACDVALQGEVCVVPNLDCAVRGLVSGACAGTSFDRTHIQD